MNGFKAGFAFIEILLVAALMLFLCYKVFNFYFKKGPLNAENSKALSEQGIDTSNYKTITDSTKERLRVIQKQRLQEIEDTK